MTTKKTKSATAVNAKKASGKKTSGTKKASGKKTSGTKKASGKKTSGTKKASGKKTSATKKTSAKKASAKKASGKKTSGKKTSGKKTSGKKTSGKKTSGKKTSAKKKTSHRRASQPPKSKSSGATVALVQRVRASALGFPEAYEEFPWDHSVAKVRKKVFVFLDNDDVVTDRVRFSVKLPHSNEIALTLPFATPTGYGMARSGWVSFSFTVAEAPPMDMIDAWLHESYCAIAPKRLSAQLQS